jgi:hypothetical protein
VTRPRVAQRPARTLRIPQQPNPRRRSRAWLSRPPGGVGAKPGRRRTRPSTAAIAALSSRPRYRPRSAARTAATRRPGSGPANGFAIGWRRRAELTGGPRSATLGGAHCRAPLGHRPARNVLQQPPGAPRRRRRCEASHTKSCRGRRCAHMLGGSRQRRPGLSGPRAPPIRRRPLFHHAGREPDSARPQPRSQAGSGRILGGGPRLNEFTVDHPGTLVGTVGHLHPGGLYDDLDLIRSGAEPHSGAIPGPVANSVRLFARQRTRGLRLRATRPRHARRGPADVENAQDPAGGHLHVLLPDPPVHARRLPNHQVVRSVCGQVPRPPGHAISRHS